MCEHFEQVLTSKQTTKQIQKRQLDEEKKFPLPQRFLMCFFTYHHNCIYAEKFAQNYVNKTRSKSVWNLTKYTSNTRQFAQLRTRISFLVIRLVRFCFAFLDVHYIINCSIFRKSWRRKKALEPLFTHLCCIYLH